MFDDLYEIECCSSPGCLKEAHNYVGFDWFCDIHVESARGNYVEDEPDDISYQWGFL